MPYSTGKLDLGFTAATAGVHAPPFVELETLDPPVIPVANLPAGQSQTKKPLPRETPAWHQFQVPSFSHGPPSSKQGQARWPLAPETQAMPATKQVSLFKVYIWLIQFLDDHSQLAARCISSLYCYGSVVYMPVDALPTPHLGFWDALS
jgi:hypothetical protein